MNVKKSSSNKSPLYIIFSAFFIGGITLTIWFLFGQYYIGRNTNSIKVGYTHETMEALTVVAKENNFFSDEGLTVDLIEYDTGKIALEKGLLKGELDIAPVANVPIIIRYIEGDDIKVITGMGRADDQLKILARKSSKIASPQDLKGKKIATQKGSAAHYFVSVFLETNDVYTQDVEFIYSDKVEELVDLITTGKADAISIKEPILSRAKQRLGENAIVFQPTKMYYKTFEYVTTNFFVKKNPQTIERFLRALQMAENFVMQDPEQSLTLFKRKEETLSKEVIDSQWKTQSLELYLDDILVDRMGDQATWVLENNLSTKKNIPEIKNLFYTNGLRNVKPASVLVDF